MKKRLSIVSVILLVLLIFLSYWKAIRVDHDALTPCLSPSLKDERVVRFGIGNPFGSLLPHWTIIYNETPTKINYDSPTITVNIFGQLSDWGSKKVVESLERAGHSPSRLRKR